MAMQLTIGTSSSSSVALKRYDVFMSFHGQDTRKSFASHLYIALSKILKTFRDDPELQKGDEISSALIKAIEESSASIVIFSKGYASSKWCLNELVKILECKKDNGQIVIPIFYEIDPSHVRNQIESYAQAFAKHEQDSKHNKEELKKWKNALREAANLAGWHSSQNYSDDPVFIEAIVKDVWEKLNRRCPFEVNKELVGIKDKHREIESLLEIGSNDVKILALWGMGGMGKTTLAKSLYAKHCSQFKRHCFLEDVRGESIRSGLNVARKHLFSTLLEIRPDAPDVETPISKRKLECEKSLIVLDDVSTLEEAENLDIVNCLGPGSRVIVTTRDKQICSQFNECAIYKVDGLGWYDSRELFYWNAFRRKHAKVGYEELSEIAISYCSGNPLALKVLGANLRTKSTEEWKSELDKLKKIPNMETLDVLKLSFNDLRSNEQDIFLDIACFFNSKLSFSDYLGRKIKPIVYSCRDYLTSLWNASNFYAESGIRALLDKSLITFSKWDESLSPYSDWDESLKMHNLLVELGRDIVKNEAPKHYGKRSRLWDPEEVCDVLKNSKGTDVVEAILFDISKIGDVHLSSDCFKSMTDLRFLHITNGMRPEMCSWDSRIVCLHFDLEWLSDKLRHLFWESFPLESLPSTFGAEWLVQLNMTHSKLKKLWDGIQKLDKLRMINLDYSKDLIEIPDLSLAPKLESVSLSYCVNLCQLHPSIFTAPELRELGLSYCRKIKILKADIHLKSLTTLDLSECSSLVEFSVTSEKMTWLSLCGTAIDEFPSSIWRNSKLAELNLSRCEKLKILGKKLSNDPGLESLTVLNLSGCTQIDTLNMGYILDGMPSLILIDLSECCNLETLPDNIQNCSKLQALYLNDCINLHSLPKLPASLEDLRAMNCTNYRDNNFVQSEMLKNMSYNLDINNKHKPYIYSLVPGAQVPCKFDYYTEETSIVIPHIPRNGLYYFLFYIIFSDKFSPYRDYVEFTVNEDGRNIFERHLTDEIGEFEVTEIIKSDHVWVTCWSNIDDDDFDMFDDRALGDHLSLSLKFESLNEGKTSGIKGLGVTPRYRSHHRLRLDGSRSSRVEIVELQPGAQFPNESDINELQHQEIGAEVRDTDDANEDDQQQLLPLTKRRRT